MNFSARLAAVQAGQADAESVGELARLALDTGEEEAALPWVAAVAKRTGTIARLWQWAGLLQRALDAHRPALDAFDVAARLAPGDASIAHGRARIAFEAGLDAVPLFEAAADLGPPNGDILIGLAAARWASGRGDEAESALDTIVAQVPLWIQGHAQLAQLRALMGRSAQATLSFERALGQQSDSLALWRGLLDLHLGHEDHGAQAIAVQRAVAAGVPIAAIADHAAIAAPP